MFKNVRLVICFEMFLNPNFKMTTIFANIAKLQLAQVNFNTRKDFKSLGTAPLHENLI